MGVLRYSSVPLRWPPCDYKGCDAHATHGLVLGDIGMLGTRYCEKHADERANYCNSEMETDEQTRKSAV